MKYSILQQLQIFFLPLCVGQRQEVRDRFADTHTCTYTVQGIDGHAGRGGVRVNYGCNDLTMNKPVGGSGSH